MSWRTGREGEPGMERWTKGTSRGQRKRARDKDNEGERVEIERGRGRAGESERERGRVLSVECRRQKM